MFDSDSFLPSKFILLWLDKRYPQGRQKRDPVKSIQGCDSQSKKAMNMLSNLKEYLPIDLHSKKMRNERPCH